MTRDDADIIPLVLVFDALALGLPITARAIMWSCNDAYGGNMPEHQQNGKETCQI